MRLIDSETVEKAIDLPRLIDALEKGFASNITTPVRHHHTIERPDGNAAMLMMPSWTEAGPDSFVGSKIVSVFPGNVARKIPSVQGSYFLAHGETGEGLAVLDGKMLTRLRTAAASGLASRFLSHPRSSSMTMIGAGALSLPLILAHCAVRPITTVTLWNRTTANAVEIAEKLTRQRPDLTVIVEPDLEKAVRASDIVSCATLSSVPLVKGAWLREGMHIDLVGAYTPTMRESDDDAVKRAQIFVDVRSGATHEAGDIVIPLAQGIITPADILADLHDLSRKLHPGRTDERAITLFKSVGNAMEDLVTAMLVWKAVSA